MPPTPPTVKSGDTGTAVQEAQYELVRFLLLEGPSAIDGVFGPLTEAAVKEFQSGEAITVDGIVGPVTWGKMLATFDIPVTLSEGSTGALVTKLQEILNIWGPGYASPWTALVVDGDFGPLTKAAVEKFQAWGSVAVDGIVGLHTWTVSLHAASATLASEVGA